MLDWLKNALDITQGLNLNSYQDALDLKGSGYPESEVKDTLKVPDSQYNYITQESMDSVEYDSQHLWALYIEGSPAPFNKWFPAQSVSEPSHGPSTSSSSFGIEEINMMNSYSAINMRVEILDDSGAHLETWLKQWQKDISSNYFGFKYPADVCKQLTIYKYNWQKVKISGMAYFVIPVGDFDLQKANEPGLKVLTVNFASFGSKPV